MALYSISKLNTYENCPRQYAFRYIEKPPLEEFEGIEAFMGLRVHETLEKLYKDIKLCKIPSPDELFGFYNDIWAKNYHDKIHIVKQGYTSENYRAVGEKAIREYYAHYHPFEDGKSIGLEVPISFKFDEGSDFTMRGFIDRLMYKGDGRYEIHDYKTSGTLPLHKHFDEDRQLALYNLGLKKLYPDAEDIELVWHYLVFDKEFRSRRTNEQLAGLADQISSLIGVVEGDREFNPSISNLCEWCDYKSICPAWNHITKTESLSPREFKDEDGVKLVDTYVRICERQNLLKAREQRVKDLLIEYSLKKNTTRINGTTHIANMVRDQDVTFPSPENPDRGELESLIRNEGKWDELSQLATSTLKSGYKKRKWPSEFMAKLQRFAIGKVSIRPRLTRKRSDNER